MNALIIGEIIFYVEVCGGGFVFQITMGFCIRLFKEYWFSMKYIVKRNNWHTFGTWVQGAFFPILNPCGYHKKRKTSHKWIIRIFSITFVILLLNSLGFCIFYILWKCSLINLSQWFRNITDLVYNLVRRNTNMATLRPSQRI